MYFNSGGIGEDSLPFRNIENLSPKKNSIRNSESAAIGVASIGASVEKKNCCKKSSLQKED